MGLKEIIQVVKVVEKIENRKESRLKPKTKVNHMNTRTTKQTIQISNNTKIQLSKIAEQIIPLVGKNTIEQIKEKFSTQAGSIISNAVRESYLLGFHFIESFKDRTIKLTAAHLKEIDEMIDSQIKGFWSSVEQIIGSKKKPLSPIVGAAGPGDLLLLNLFNKSFANSSISMSFFALNQATVRTQRQVFKEDVKINKKSIIKVTGSITVPKMLWVSERDSRVCPICLNLDGRTWDVDDNSMPRPGPGSHLGCRCRLLPLSGGKAFNA